MPLKEFEKLPMSVKIQNSNTDWYSNLRVQVTHKQKSHLHIPMINKILPGRLVPPWKVSILGVSYTFASKKDTDPSVVLIRRTSLLLSVRFFFNSLYENYTGRFLKAAE